MSQQPTRKERGMVPTRKGQDGKAGECEQPQSATPCGETAT